VLADKLRPDKKVYGPYDTDGGLRVTLVGGGKSTTISYARWTAEQELGRIHTQAEIRSWYRPRPDQRRVSRVIKAYNDGVDFRTLADEFGITRRALSSMMTRARAKGLTTRKEKYAVPIKSE
jgi:hypothetical protein